MNSKIIIGIIAVGVIIGIIVAFQGSGTQTAVTPDTAPPADDMDPQAMPEPDSLPEVSTAPEFGSLVDVAAGNENLTTLVTAVSEAGVAPVLDAEGPFTIFAPQDSAFAQLPAGALEELLLPENNAQLQELLANHVVVGATNAADLSDGMTLTTLNEEQLTVSIAADGTVQIGDSTVVTADIQADNGVIHIIDAVIQ